MTTLEEDYFDNLYAPYVKIAPVQMGMTYVEEYHIKENGTILLIGEIQHVNINDSLLKEDGFVNLAEANVVAINGLLRLRCAYITNTFGVPKTKKSILRV